MIFIVLGIIVVGGAIGAIIFSKWKKDNPIMNPDLHKPGVENYLVAASDPNKDPTMSMKLESNDPDFNVYQTWQTAKRLARKDLPAAIAEVEGTIAVSPDLAGDAYFTMAQCVEFSMELPLWGSKDNPQLSASEIRARYDQEFGYYEKAIDAYSRPNARSLLGITRDPEEQLRKIRDVIIDDKKKIRDWWLARVGG